MDFLGFAEVLWGLGAVVPWCHSSVGLPLENSFAKRSNKQVFADCSLIEEIGKI